MFAAYFTARQASGLISPAAYAALRTAGRSATVWAVAALVLWPFDAAANVGAPLHRMLSWPALYEATGALQSSKSWLITAALTAALAVACHRTLRWRTTPVLSALAILATLPIITAGQSSSDTDHDLATAAIALHIPAATVWLGTLIALLRARGIGPDRGALLRRYRRLSIGCWSVVVLSGLIDGALLAPGTSFFTTSYGAVLLTKVGLTTGLGYLLLRLRRRMLVGEAPPWRLLTTELAALIAAFGLSAALTGLPAPKFLLDIVSADQTILGYDITAPPTALRLLTDWRIDLLFAPLCLTLAAFYLAGVRRLGSRWPWQRTAAWLAGCAVLLLATSSGLGRYGAAMFSIEATDHMLVGMLAPMLLALGAPLSLAEAAVRPAAPADPPGPREWLSAAGGAWARAVIRPPAVTMLFVGAPFLLYFTDAYDLTVRYHWAHLGMDLLFLVIGYLFAWVVVGADPPPAPAPALIRLSLLLVAMPFDVVLAAAILATRRIIGNDTGSATLYQALDLPWVSSLAADQRLGAYLGLAVSEAVMFTMLVVLVTRWRPAGPDHDYQEMLDVLGRAP